MTGFMKLLAFAVSVACAGCAAVPVQDSGPAALGLRDELRRSGADYRSPLEFRSFSDTLTRAEVMFAIGKREDAEKLYRLSILKGALLKESVGRHEAPSPPDGIDPSAQGGSATDEPNAASSPDAAPEQPVPAEPPPPVPAAEQPLPPAASPRPAPPAGSAAQIPAAPPGERVLPDDGTASLLDGERSRVAGTRATYLVRKNDTLKRVGARLGVDWRLLAKINGIDPKQKLTVGQEISYDNHKIVPKRVRDGIVINIPDRTLYLFRSGQLKKAYPVAVGRPQKPDDDELWKTPTGRFTITAKQKDPTWKVPPSIREEMERKGEEVLTEVLPGGRNPLGRYALRTSLPGILIHGTTSPASIYSFSSHGCIRVNPDHMEELFQAVSTQTPGEIIYQPVKLLASRTGRVFLEVHRDIYNVYGGDLAGEAKRLIRNGNVAGRVDWKRVARSLKRSSGIPEEITLTDEAARPDVPPATARLAGTPARTGPIP